MGLKLPTMRMPRSIAATNTAEFWAANRQRHADAVDAPTHALAVALQAEFGPPRVFRPYVNRRFRPGADPYRTDAGLAVTTGGGAVLSAVLSAASLTVAAGHWDAAVALNDKNDWDLAAAVLLVREAGSVATDRHGREFMFNRPRTVQNGAIAAGAGLHALILEKITTLIARL